MADQEFLASFGVDIDESGVNRLQTILSENADLSKDLASAFTSAYSGLQSLAAEASGSVSSFSGFQAAQQQAVSVAEEAASAITYLSAAYQGLTGSLPSGTLDLSLGIDGEDRNGSDRDSETNASLLSTIANAVTGLATSDDDGSSFGADASSGSDVNAALDLDFSKADAQIASFLSSAESQFRLSADASGIVSAAVDALDTIQNTYGGTKLSLEVDSSKGDEAGETGNVHTGRNISDSTSISASGSATGSGTEPGSQSASGSDTETGSNRKSGANASARRSSTGGRFTVPTMVEVAEDGGKEYIIPVDKESIAVPLLRQMMSELSAEARQALTGNGQNLNSAELSLNDLQGITRDGQVFADPKFSIGELKALLGYRQTSDRSEFSVDDLQATAIDALSPNDAELSDKARKTTQPLSGTFSEPSLEMPDLSGVLNSITNQIQQEAPEQLSSFGGFFDTLPDLERLISEDAVLIPDAIGSDLSADSDWPGLLAELRETVSAAPQATGVTVQQNTTNNVQAPVNISVTASGSDTEALGRAVYDSAERYLVRTLERVCE